MRFRLVRFYRIQGAISKILSYNIYAIYMHCTYRSTEGHPDPESEGAQNGRQNTLICETGHEVVTRLLKIALSPRDYR